jgi:hypothetical protein
MLKKDSVPHQLIEAIYNIYGVNVIAVEAGTELSGWEALNQDVC